MIRIDTNCEDCVKGDVCSIKSAYKLSIESISKANTTLDDEAIHFAKDNKDINVIVICTKFYTTGRTRL